MTSLFVGKLASASISAGVTTYVLKESFTFNRGNIFFAGSICTGAMGIVAFASTPILCRLLPLGVLLPVGTTLSYQGAKYPHEKLHCSSK